MRYTIFLALLGLAAALPGQVVKKQISISTVTAAAHPMTFWPLGPLAATATPLSYGTPPKPSRVPPPAQPGGGYLPRGLHIHSLCSPLLARLSIYLHDNQGILPDVDATVLLPAHALRQRGAARVPVFGVRGRHHRRQQRPRQGLMLRRVRRVL
ncbi:hypothetical protein CIB48_g5422 [Xylaria polymorpha]|nr:hypothetical protein CIB48_g5422 [Xylaria polymorpha]